MQDVGYYDSQGHFVAAKTSAANAGADVPPQQQPYVPSNGYYSNPTTGTAGTNGAIPSAHLDEAETDPDMMRTGQNTYVQSQAQTTAQTTANQVSSDGYSPPQGPPPAHTVGSQK